ncbi:hypothetical protein [Leuconostoc fallax]|uniref:Uncharacterized protein n=1 Tax=Leuconostoc fallax TaxID=1251 RepID=A0A4V3A2D6_9LACO|nr:hypothetical protein [Leuconostoc fallax]MBU7455867.1 hypothetical protein [Leuconostoc fallax]TDG68048.1 hypothetical protein C5L23_000354 [Leuconostoc fallax]
MRYVPDITERHDSTWGDQFYYEKQDRREFLEHEIEISKQEIDGCNDYIAECEEELSEMGAD